MVNIVKSPPSRLLFSFDKQKNKFVPVRVADMKSDQIYYMVEPNEPSISTGIFKKIGDKAYNQKYPNTPIRGNWDLYLFIKRTLYPSITEVNHQWEPTNELVSLSTSNDNDGSISFFDKKYPSVADVGLFQLARPQDMNIELLVQFFADIHHHLEDMAIYNHLQHLYSNAFTESGLKEWQEFKNLNDLYAKTNDNIIRDKLIFIVAVTQKKNPDEVFESLLKNRLMAYRNERLNRPEEYFTIWAQLFGGKQYSRTAKIDAVDTILRDLDEGVFDFNHLPKAAQNSSLGKLLSDYKAFADTQESLCKTMGLS